MKPCYKYEVCVVPDTKTTKEPARSLIKPAYKKLREFWKDVGGTLYEDPRISSRESELNNYWVQGIILADGPTKKAPNPEWLPLAGRDVTIVHSTDRILRMYTLGAGTFGAEVALKHKPKKFRSMFLVNATDSVLEPVIDRIPYLEVNLDYAHIKG